MNILKTIVSGVIVLITVHNASAQQTRSRVNIKDRTEEALDNYYYCRFFSCNTDTSKYFYLPYGKGYYTENAKQKLLSILNLDVSDKSIETLALQIARKETQRNIQILRSLVQDTISRKAKVTSYKETLDSLTRKDSLHQYSPMEIANVVSKLKAVRPGNDVIIKAALIDDERFIPAFRKILMGGVQSDTTVAKLALARFRIEPYYQNVIRQFYDIDAIIKSSNDKGSYYEVREYQLKAEAALLFVCTPESIKKYASLLGCRFYAPPVDYDVVYYPIPAKVLEGLSNVIENKDFKAYLASIKYIPSGVTAAHIDWVKKWLLENKDNLQLNRDYCPKGLF